MSITNTAELYPSEGGVKATYLDRFQPGNVDGFRPLHLKDPFKREAQRDGLKRQKPPEPKENNVIAKARMKERKMTMGSAESDGFDKRHYTTATAEQRVRVWHWAKPRRVALGLAKEI